MAQDVYENTVNCRSVLRSQIQENDPMEIDIIQFFIFFMCLFKKVFLLVVLM